MEDQTPDPVEQAEAAVETVRVLKSDFELLQMVADMAVEDTEMLAHVLGVVRVPTMSHREFFLTRILPTVQRLVATQRNVDQAAEAIRARAAQLGNKTIEHNGVKGLLVGQKIPGLFGPEGG